MRTIKFRAKRARGEWVVGNIHDNPELIKKYKEISETENTDNNE